MPDHNKKITRRELLQSSGLLGLGLLGLGSASVSETDTRYDFIVVGSGAGGGPLSANLASGGFKVLLLEAGDDTSNLNYSVPAFHPLSVEDPAFSWNYFVNHYPASSPYSQLDSKYVPGKGILYPRAGTLGGCTAHNALVTLYPDNDDWDLIAQLTDDPSWNSSLMWEYFNRVRQWLSIETTPLQLVLQDPQLTKVGLDVFQETAFLSQYIARLLAEAGQGNPLKTFNLDPNDRAAVDAREQGVFIGPKATIHGMRNGVRERINQVRSQYPKNLILKTNALATKILFKDGTNEAVGIRYLEGAHLYEADPNSSASQAASAKVKHALLAPGGEVILCGGAFNSPQLLMLSGVGPPDVLDANGISVKVPLEGVGKNLQDRYEISVINRLKKPVSLLENCTYYQTPDPCLDSYFKNPQGTPYGSNGIALGIKKKSSSSQANPDLFIFGIPGYFRGYYPGWSKDYFKPDHFSWVILKGHTANVGGELTLKSANPLQTPDINFNYFESGTDTAGEDLNAVLSAMKFVRKITRNSYFQSISAGQEIPVPGTSGPAIADFIRREAWGHHASCTNKMGQASDPLAVVDSNFKVHQTKNLRVVDASVFPRIPGLFICLPIYMISEKASDVILQEARSKS
jgi:choline dehydrogenase